MRFTYELRGLIITFQISYAFNTPLRYRKMGFFVCLSICMRVGACLSRIRDKSRWAHSEISNAKWIEFLLFSTFRECESSRIEYHGYWKQHFNSRMIRMYLPLEYFLIFMFTNSRHWLDNLKSYEPKKNYSWFIHELLWCATKTPFSVPGKSILICLYTWCLQHLN